MEISVTQFKRCDLVRVVGRVDSHSAPDLSQTLHAIFDSNRFKVVLDLSQVDYISSAGLRALIDAQKTCKRWNRGQVVLAGVPPSVLEVLDLVGFRPLFQLYRDATSAVASF